MNGASPAHSSVSTTAVAGGGGSSGAAAGLDDFPFPPDIPSMQDRKDEAMRVLKTDLMGELEKEVKSLEEDSWMFQGPRSRIHLISRRVGNFLKRDGEAVVKSSIVQLPR
ncbi:BnaA05g36500D [Brassica napus]|uniref:BnaA05g36500D protein n=1 Tax=Brassica napus TaxID=3708 RepID=A0A078JBL5_BRANA|nr:BnaA05g36500D [Brassica napus]